MFILFFFLKLLDVIILFLMVSFLFMAKRFDFIMGFLFFLMEFITLPRSSAFALLGASGSRLDLLVLGFDLGDLLSQLRQPILSFAEGFFLFMKILSETLLLSMPFLLILFELSSQRSLFKHSSTFCFFQQI